MKKLSLASMGLNFESDDITEIPFLKNETLLDYDVLIIDPRSLSYQLRELSKDDILKSNDSASAKSLLLKKRKEIDDLLSRGKIVVTFIAENFAFRANSEPDKYPLHSYYFHPLQDTLLSNLDFTPGKGKNLRLVNRDAYFSPIFEVIKKGMRYQGYFTDHRSKKGNFFISNKADLPVAWEIRFKTGLAVFLPNVNECDENELRKSVLSCSNHFFEGKKGTPPPPWAETFKVQGQTELSKAAEDIKSELSTIEQKLHRVNEEYGSLDEFKALLYANGEELEAVVKKAFKTLGFEVSSRNEDQGEHDLIFSSTEGRGLGEIEGKDKRQIQVPKLSQLYKNLSEDHDLNEDEDASFPHGILIGNPFRLKNPKDRDVQPFSKKAMSTPIALEVGFLTTTELFEMVNRVLADPTNEDLKKEFRLLMLTIKGKLIKCPRAKKK